MKFHLYIMDVSSAFGQSDPHEREQGPLFASIHATDRNSLVMHLTASSGC